ncbi:hypothetical protein COU36_04460 [Candidatus Micrarchaeota archaeon CG10_big_fil_rev_8_21_14_0_10_59_7]|nr:MAG: hypothetical protein COU36_04460 [Candidatus Micrarchaeota archaeon CG10_big_fil_rev_8_21_14_0_10_59_7]
MNMHSRHELTKSVLPRYLRAGREGKSRILDEFCANTGYNRKYATSKLRAYRYAEALAFKVPGRHRRHRKKVYDAEVRAALAPLWEASDHLSSKLFHPHLPELIRVLTAHREIALAPHVERKLLAMSHGTCAALLDEIRTAHQKKLHGTTKPGTFLKSQIPLRVGTWNETEPGYAEIDLVAHCGESLAGEFAYTLDFTDIATGWVERRAVMGRPQERTHYALKDIRQALPFALRGIDSDNDSTFINQQLWRWCEQERIDFTRSRPYKKNDNAHVEQKNWTCVRKIFGYARIDLPRQVALMNTLYRGPLRRYTNFFKPVMKCVEKQRVGARVVKRYDRPRTPYERVLESKQVDAKTKVELAKLYQTLNPLALRRDIDAALALLFAARTRTVTSSRATQKVVLLPQSIPAPVG